MSQQISLPPAGRDFLLYERIVIAGLSTRSAAEEANLSQTRVRQIVRRVADWLSSEIPAQAPLDDAARLRFGQHLAADRLEYLYRDAMTQWRSTHQPKFAGLAIRVIAAQARVPALPGTLEALAADALAADASEESSRHTPCADPAPAASSSPPPDPTSNPEPRNTAPPFPPPVRACSPAPPTIAAHAASNPQEPATTSPAAEPYANLPPAVRAARSAFLAPAHLPTASENDSPVTELSLTPAALGLRTKNSLSRKDRRRLRRQACTAS